jgi:Secretion system C-terminal sorting domain/Cleaved Adhesin Domain
LRFPQGSQAEKAVFLLKSSSKPYPHLSMKKSLLLASTVFVCLGATAQNDTLLWNNFETDPALYIQFNTPSGNATDPLWYTLDLDGQADGSSTGNRPPEWFWSAPFSDLDTIGNTSVMASSSWTNSSQPTENILVTPSVFIGDTNATLYWKATTRQTPRYLDGYQVLIAGTSNDLTAFLDTVFVASEYTSLDNQGLPFDFSSYTFTPGPTLNPMAPFVHGMDGTYTELDPSSDSSRLVGLLRPFSVDLSAYSGQTIFVMFRHYCVDDNLICVDDILITGTDMTGIQESEGGIAFKTYPNPANDVVHISFELVDAAPVTINVYDITGKLVQTEQKGNLSPGYQNLQIDLGSVIAGVYRVELVTGNVRSNSRVVVQ